jgi:4'-phosphopantetheinyl transferase
VEGREVAALAADAQNDAFLRCWTRKEAVAKATGQGLDSALQSARVTSAAGDSARLIQLDGSAGAADTWSLYDVDPTTDYLGAVALHAPACRITCFTLSPNALGKQDRA